jgi:hypothetical protein
MERMIDQKIGMIAKPERVKHADIFKKGMVGAVL